MRFVAVSTDSVMPSVFAFPDLQAAKDGLKRLAPNMPGSVWFVLDTEAVKVRRFVLPTLAALPDATDTTPP